MSSHHVIRDEQEPPVYIFDIQNNIDQIRQLLGWSPTVWVTEACAEWLMSENIKVDGVFSADPVHHKRLKQQGENYRVEGYKEEYPLNAIISSMRGKNYTGINIFCNSSQKEEMLLSIIESSLSIPVSIFNATEKTIITFKLQFRKWYAKGQKFTVNRGQIVETSHLRKENNTFVVQKEGLFHLHAEKGPIVLTEF